MEKYLTFKLWEGTVPHDTPDLPMANEMRFYTAGEGKRPCLLVLPGGGYGFCRPDGHEGAAIAEYFVAQGFHAAVLTYRLVPHRYPAALSDAQRGMRILRANADALGILPDKIAAIGFSAGGNLTASLAVLPDEAKIGDALDEYSPRPNACLLCYPAIDLHDPHIASGRSLFAEKLPENVEQYSLQNRVTDETVPTFFFHTSDDSGVSVKHSLVYAAALRDHGVPFEMHIYPHGKHGLGLALDKPDASGWPALAVAWLRRTL